MKKNPLILTIVLMILYSSVSTAYSTKTELAKLDTACENARQKALAPRKEEIYQECLTKFKKDKSVCQRQADAYNGNRINGAPMFYEFPACVKAFEFRKK